MRAPAMPPARPRGARKALATVGVTALALVPLAAPEASSGGVTTDDTQITTYNVLEQTNGTPLKDPWVPREAGIARVLTALDSDIVGLQEVAPISGGTVYPAQTLQHALNTALAGSRAYAMTLHTASISPATYVPNSQRPPVALLWDSNKYRAGRSGAIDADATATGSSYPKVEAVYQLLTRKSDSQVLAAVTLHLVSSRGGAANTAASEEVRRRQMVTIRDKVSAVVATAYPGRAVPTFYLGDFNATETLKNTSGVPLGDLPGRVLSDAGFRDADNGLPGASYTNLVSNTPSATTPPARNSFHYDRIFLGPSVGQLGRWRLDIVQPRVSDHSPVTVDVGLCGCG